MHPKNIRANLATASLVVIATCLAGPHLIRGGKFLWDYPVRQDMLWRQQLCLHNETYLMRKGSLFYEKFNYNYPIWQLDPIKYEKCLESWEVPADSLIEQPRYFVERPEFPANANWLEEFMWFLRDPLDNIYWWFKSFD